MIGDGNKEHLALLQGDLTTTLSDVALEGELGKHFVKVKAMVYLQGHVFFMFVT